MDVPRPWLESYPPGVPATYHYPAVPLTRFLDDAARDFPDAEATWFDGAVLRYAELADRVDRLAAALVGFGVGPATAVGVALPDIPAHPVAALAAFRLGAVVVLLRPDSGILETLDRCGCDVVVTTSAVAELLRQPGRPSPPGLVVTDPGDWVGRRGGRLRASARRFRRRGGGTAAALVDLVADCEPVSCQAPVALDGPALLLPTADLPVTLTHRQLVAAAFQGRLWVPDIQAGQERVALVAPLAGVYGFTVGMLAGLLSAATLVFPPAGRGLAGTAPARPTLLVTTPAGLAVPPGNRRAARGFAPLRAGLVGEVTSARGAPPCPERLWGARIRQVHGTLGACGLTHANPVYGRAEPGTVGLPVTDTVAAIVDPDDPRVLRPPGTAGALAVRGPQLPDGWLVTGDLAVMDERGYFGLLAPSEEAAT